MIKYLLFIVLPIGLISQSFNSIETLFKKSGFYLEDFSIRLDSGLTENSDTYELKLDQLKVSLSELSSYYKIDKFKKIFNFKVYGPDLKIKNISINRSGISNNWIIRERIKQLKKRESIPKDALIILQDAIFKYEVDKLELPKSLDQLSIEKYIDLKKNPFTDQAWGYQLNLPESISAEPTRYNSIPENRKIIYDWILKKFIVNPELISLSKSPLSNWQYNIGIKEINNLISSAVEIIIDSSQSNYQLRIDKNQFEINELIFDAIPDKNLNQRTRVHIPSLRVQLYDLIIDMDLSKSFIFHQGKVHLKLQNFEIKIPSELREEPSIQKVINQFGIWNNSFLIKELNFILNIINENTSELELIVNTPIIKLNLLGGLSLKQSIFPPEVNLDKVKVEVNPISIGLKTFIKEWEKEHDVELERENGIVFLNLEGLLKNPSIKNLAKPMFLFKKTPN